MTNTKVLCGANSYEQKYYFNQDFSPLPQSIQDRLHTMCILYTEDAGGTLAMELDGSGSLELKVAAPEGGYLSDGIGSILRIKQYQEEKRELLKVLELYYRTFFLKEETTLDEDREGQMKLGIGNTLLENSVTLAPMAGVTDLPFRLLCRKQGADCVVTEMVNTKAILYNSRNTRELLQIHPQERPAAVQPFGPDPEIMGEITIRIEDGPHNFIGVNMGCSVPKAVDNGEGSALMEDPKKVSEILVAMVRAVRKLVTVKFREGFNSSHVSEVEFARIAENCEVTAVVIHGRTREQHYSDRADWDITRRVKKTVKIPVIGNGDIFTPQGTKRMMEGTGCNGLMVTRGAKGNPWTFRWINHYLDTGGLLPEPSMEEIREMILHCDRMLVEYKGESTAMCGMRGHMAWHTKGMSHSAALRNEINQAETLEGLAELLNQRISVSTGGKDGSHP